MTAVVAEISSAGCPLCGATSAGRACRVDDAEVWRCRACGLGQTVPPPVEADGHERFAADERYFRDAVAQAKDRWWHRFNEAPLELLAAAGIGPGCALLDVGCNVGYLVASARARGYVARGLDASPVAVAVGREHFGVDLVCARVETAPVARTSQDVVVLNHVLEHLPRPIETLTQIREWLKPSGVVLVALPNFGSPLARFGGPRWAGLVPTQHVWHFSAAALARALASAGLSPLRWRTRMLPYTPHGVGGWGKWLVRRALEPLSLADNLMVVAGVR